MYNSSMWWYCLPGLAKLVPQDRDLLVKTVIFFVFLVPALNTELYSHFPSLVLGNLFRFHGDWRSNIVFFFLHGESVVQQQDAFNEEHKIIRNTYILNIYEQFPPSDCLGTRSSALLPPWGWVISSRRFEETYRLHFQGYGWIHWLITF
jgi:hypothetical protein